MAIKINSGLLPAVVALETTFGVAPKTFIAHDGLVKGLPVNQALESPINVVDTYNKEVIKSTFGSQVQKDGVLLLGQRDVTANFGHQIGLNDFATIGSMFFQNKYTYIPTMIDDTLVSIVSLVDTVTITLTDIGTLVEGDKIVIEGRTTNTLEDGEYAIKNVAGNAFDITFVGGFEDGDLTGTFKSVLNTHTMLIEDVNDCNSQTLENSYSIYLPSKFADNDGVCSTSQGELYSGVVPKMLDIDFIEASYTIDTMGKSLEDAGATSPRSDLDYALPNGQDGFMRKNFGTLQKWNGTSYDDLETLSLNLNVTLGSEDSQKVRKAGELSRAVIDGVELSGTYETLYLSEDEVSNVSASIYENRSLLQSGGLYRLALVNTSGEAIYVDGNIKFYGEELTRELGGWKLKADFQFLRNDLAPNITLTCINGYEDLTDLF